jgi:hypothetical protein
LTTKTLDVGTGRCRACGLKITWVPKPEGGYHPPMTSLGGPGFALVSGKLVEAQLLLQRHECDQQLRAELEFRRVAYDEAVRSIDCPHPRCNGKQGGPCISLVDGVTELRSYHQERVRAVPIERFPKPFGGELG